MAAAANERPYLRVGHRGAAALAPENTLASLAAALELGVDLVEFDIVDVPDGRLVLSHSRAEVRPGAPTLDEALAFLAREAPEHVGIALDLKWHGRERDVAVALARYGLVERTIACSFFPASLRALRASEPALRTGLSYPWDRRGLSERRALAPVVTLGAAALRRALPLRVAGMVGRAAASHAMLHFSVLSPAAVERCHRDDVRVFAWTVDEPALLERVVAAGVDGVISNDPRIFRDGYHRGSC